MPPFWFLCMFSYLFIFLNFSIYLIWFFLINHVFNARTKLKYIIHIIPRVFRFVLKNIFQYIQFYGAAPDSPWIYLSFLNLEKSWLYLFLTASAGICQFHWFRLVSVIFPSKSYYIALDCPQPIWPFLTLRIHVSSILIALSP